MWLVVLLVLDRSASAEGPVPRGDYFMSNMQETKVMPQGRDLPACLPSKQRYLAGFRGAVIRYRDEVFVDGVRWTTSRCTKNCASANTKDAELPDPPPGVRVTVVFWTEKRAGVGVVMYERLDREGEATCVDARKFSGRYVPR